MPLVLCTCIHAYIYVGSDVKDVNEVLCVYVISIVHCALHIIIYVIYILYMFVVCLLFLYCAHLAHVSYKHLTNSLLHYIKLTLHEYTRYYFLLITHATVVFICNKTRTPGY